jgi:hypothetical protein
MSISIVGAKEEWKKAQKIWVPYLSEVDVSMERGRREEKKNHRLKLKS